MRASPTLVAIALAACSTQERRSPSQETSPPPKIDLAAWEAKWLAARTCLLGAAPVSTDLGEALLAQHLVTEGERCDLELDEREQRTDQPAVERAWGTFTRAVDKLRLQLHHDEKLPEIVATFSAVEAAHRELRAAAGQAALPQIAATRLPTVELVQLGVGSPASSVSPKVSVTNNSIVARFGNDTLVLAPGGAVRVRKGRVVRSISHLEWGVRDGQLGKLEVGSVTADGENLAKSTALRIGPRQEGDARFATGNAERGTFAFTLGERRPSYDLTDLEQFVVARSIGGAVSADPPRKHSGLRWDVEPSGRAFLVWFDDKFALRALVLVPGVKAAPIELGEGQIHAWDGACHTQARGWISTDDSYGTFDATRGKLVEQEVRLFACSREAAVFYQKPEHYLVCTEAAAEACREVSLVGVPTPTPMDNLVEDVALGLEGSRVVIAASKDRVLGIWREGAAPRFFALPAPFDPQHLVTDGKVVDLLGGTDDDYAIVRVSL